MPDDGRNGEQEFRSLARSNETHASTTDVEHQRAALGDSRRTTRHPGYAISQRLRKQIEKAFGWAKNVAELRKARHRRRPKVDWQFALAMAAYNLVHLPRLLGGAA